MEVDTTGLLTPVCYGGNFDVCATAFADVPEGVYEKMLTTLSRGSSVEEGVLMKRVHGFL